MKIEYIVIGIIVLFYFNRSKNGIRPSQTGPAVPIQDAVNEDIGVTH